MYVSEEAFEKGLSWLERQVALKQAALRGFFTYADLAAAGAEGGEGAAALARHVACACAALALGYLASLAALLAAALLVAHTWPAPAPTPAPAPAPPHALRTDHIHTPLPNFNNVTTDSFETVLEEPVVAGSHKCCTRWLKYQEVQDDFAPQKNWYDGAVLDDWKSYEPWWSTTSVLNWLYQSSLINPMQRWLDELGAFSDLLGGDESSCGGERGGGGAGAARQSRDTRRPHCVRQWLNLSKLNALMVTVSDR